MLPYTRAKNIPNNMQSKDCEMSRHKRLLHPRTFEALQGIAEQQWTDPSHIKITLGAVSRLCSGDIKAKQSTVCRRNLRTRSISCNVTLCSTFIHSSLWKDGVRKSPQKAIMTNFYPHRTQDECWRGLEEKPNFLFQWLYRTEWNRIAVAQKPWCLTLNLT